MPGRRCPTPCPRRGMALHRRFPDTVVMGPCIPHSKPQPDRAALQLSGRRSDLLRHRPGLRRHPRIALGHPSDSGRWHCGRWQCAARQAPAFVAGPPHQPRHSDGLGRLVDAQFRPALADRWPVRFIPPDDRDEPLHRCHRASRKTRLESLRSSPCNRRSRPVAHRRRDRLLRSRA